MIAGDALAVIVATAVAGITFGLWRKLMQQRSTIQEKEGRLCVNYDVLMGEWTRNPNTQTSWST